MDNPPPLSHTDPMSYDSRDIFLRLARYNARTNEALYEALAGLTGRARRRDRAAWFGSLLGIGHHILLADLHWLNRFRPLAPSSSVLNDPRLTDRDLSWSVPVPDRFDDHRADRVLADELLLAWFEEYPSSGYGEAFTYRNSAGNDITTTAVKAFEFVFLHQTHHRGQMSQILDELGVPHSLADNGDYQAAP